MERINRKGRSNNRRDGGKFNCQEELLIARKNENRSYLNKIKANKNGGLVRGKEKIYEERKLATRDGDN